jgi:uncharacterized protein YdhG (YjbR/CyaY superfamily)
LRRDVLAVVPDAEQCISYGVPAFKVNGTTVAGFAAFRHHLSYLPHSGSVLPALGDDLAGYRGSTKSALHFAPASRFPPIWCASCSKPGCANTTHGRPDQARS